MYSWQKHLICLVASAISYSCYGQWNIFDNAPPLQNGFRFDDVYFTDRQHGSFTTQDGFIHTTFDGGESWISSPKFGVYLRSIEYVNSDVGFAGSLNDVYLRTDNGGLDWVDISDRLPAEHKKICGLAHYTDQYVYGVGNYAGPAVFFKSEDGGDTWTANHLDSLLFGAIDVYFKSPMEGYICGAGPDTGDLAYEGRILRTLDGGESWTIWMKTGEPFTYIWKMDFLDDQTIFGSLETFLGERPAIIRSFDAGQNWEVVDLAPDPEYPFDGQGIGFLNKDLGWFAGYGFGLYETVNGGLDWVRKYETANINRFFRVDSSLMIGAGFNLYFFDQTTVSAVDAPGFVKDKIPHSITNLTPNPTRDQITIAYRLDRNTSVLMDICSVQGNQVIHLFKKDQEAGSHEFEVNISALPPGLYFFVLRTHERHLSEMFVKVD